MLGVLLEVADGLVIVDAILDTLMLVVPGPALALASDEDELLGSGGGFMDENVCKVDWSPYINVEVQ